jgi:hypothetical protein
VFAPHNKLGKGEWCAEQQWNNGYVYVHGLRQLSVAMAMGLVEVLQ